MQCELCSLLAVALLLHRARTPNRDNKQHGRSPQSKRTGSAVRLSAIGAAPNALLLLPATAITAHLNLDVVARIWARVCWNQQHWFRLIETIGVYPKGSVSPWIAWPLMPARPILRGNGLLANDVRVEIRPITVVFRAALKIADRGEDYGHIFPDGLAETSKVGHVNAATTFRVSPLVKKVGNDSAFNAILFDQGNHARSSAVPGRASSRRHTRLQR
jgi:hypothetical protein